MKAKKSTKKPVLKTTKAPVKKALQSEEPTSMRTMLTQALMEPRPKGLSVSGRGGIEIPYVTKVKRVMNEEQMLEVVSELDAAVVGLRMILARAEGVLSSLSREIETVKEMKEEFTKISASNTTPVAVNTDNTEAK